MFERFTDRARRSVVLAQEGTRLRNGSSITAMDVLWGILSEGESRGTKMLTDLGVTVGYVEDLQGTEEGEPPPGHIPFTDTAKKCIEYSLRAALKLGHNYIGTEHMVLGLLSGQDEEVLTALAEFDITEDSFFALVKGDDEPPAVVPEVVPHKVVLLWLDLQVIDDKTYIAANDVLKLLEGGYTADQLITLLATRTEQKDT